MSTVFVSTVTLSRNRFVSYSSANLRVAKLTEHVSLAFISLMTRKLPHPIDNHVFGAEILPTRVKAAQKDKNTLCQEVMGGNLHAHAMNAT